MGACDIDKVQLWLATGIRLFPVVEKLFLAKLVGLAIQQKVCILPQYQMQMYCDKFKKAN